MGSGDATPIQEGVAGSGTQTAAPDELRRRNAELALLFETVCDLTSTLSVREVLQRLLDRTLAHLEAETGSILLLGSDRRLRIVVAQGLPPDVISQTRLRLGDRISGHVAKTGESLLVADIECDERFSRRNHERYYTSSFISVPLIVQDEVRGVINVNNKRNRQTFTHEDLKLVELLGGHAAMALRNAHRYEEMLERAQRDALTGLANHGHLWESLEREVSRADRYDGMVGVAMIDIDHFKAYNDLRGHPTGDAALARVAEILVRNSRAHDVVARYGGEEFTVILPETNVEGCHAFAEKIRQSIASTRFGKQGEDHLTVSVGTAVFPGEAASAAHLIRVADRRLYRAKSLGRNRVCSSDG